MFTRLFPSIGQEDGYNQCIKVVNGRKRKMLLAAPVKSGRTSLLFQYALSFAEADEHVLFLSPTPLDKLPLLSEGKQPPTAKALKYITMIYPKTVRQLLQFLASAHTTEGNVPHAIVVDNLDYYFTNDSQGLQRNHVMTTVCAYLYDAIEFFSSKLKCMNLSKVDCQLAATINSNILQQSEEIVNEPLKEWFFPVLLVTETAGQQKQSIQQHIFHLSNYESPDVALLTYQLYKGTLILTSVCNSLSSI